MEEIQSDLPLGESGSRASPKSSGPSSGPITPRPHLRSGDMENRTLAFGFLYFFICYSLFTFLVQL
jgi:hypothetical protein